MVQALVGLGASHAAQDASGARPIHFAVRSGRSAAALAALLAAGAKPTSAAADGTTPLHLAAAAEGTDLLRTLLEGRSLPPKKLKKKLRGSGLTPLHVAAAGNCPAAIRALLAAGASAGSGCAARRAPLHLAAQALHVAAVRELLAGGAAPGAADKQGDTALHCVVRAYEGSKRELCVTVATVLLEAGADPLATNRKGESPLSLAKAAAGEEEEGVQQLERLLERAAESKKRTKPATGKFSALFVFCLCLCVCVCA